MNNEAKLCTCPPAHPNTCEYCRATEVARRVEARFFCTCERNGPQCRPCSEVVKARQAFTKENVVPGFLYQWPANLLMPDRAPGSWAA